MPQHYSSPGEQSSNNPLGEAAMQTASRVQEAATDQLDRLGRNIRTNPLAAVGIAAGVGLVLALLARR